MAVFRVERNSGYTVMSNHHLRNKELTLKAKGLLSQMLSLPEDWDYTLAGLSHINRESIDAIRTAVWELEKAGYILRRQGRDEKGKMTAIEYTIYEQPQPVLENPIPGKPMLENPTTDNPMSENPTQLNAAARSSTLNAHYTSPTVIRSIYDAVERMGFRSGNILEPSMGVGNFFGMLPDSMADSRLYGVELDSITGRIAKIPKEQIVTKRYEKETTERKNHLQDLQTQRDKAEKDLLSLKAEILACIKGESVLPRETLAEMITEQEEKLKELEDLCESASEELERTAELMDKVSRLYDELISYADLYDSANFEAKKMVVNQLIRRVDVYRGYQINISFNFDLTPYIEGE